MTLLQCLTNGSHLGGSFKNIIIETDCLLGKRNEQKRFFYNSIGLFEEGFLFNLLLWRSFNGLLANSIIRYDFTELEMLELSFFITVRFNV